MKNPTLNLFIVDDNKLMVHALRNYLENKFGKGINISIFYDGESCLQKINKSTNIVILDYFFGRRMESKNGIEILRSIKEINPETEVIIHSSNEEFSASLESIRSGASNYIVKDKNSWARITSLIDRFISAPIRAIAAEFGIPKFMGIFFLTFFAVGMIVILILQLLKI